MKNYAVDFSFGSHSPSGKNLNGRKTPSRKICHNAGEIFLKRSPQVRREFFRTSDQSREKNALQIFQLGVIPRREKIQMGGKLRRENCDARAQKFLRKNHRECIANFFGQATIRVKKIRAGSFPFGRNSTSEKNAEAGVS